MKQEVIGSYLDRQVYLTAIRDLINLSNGDYAHSSALIWLLKSDWKSENYQNLIKTLASKGTLAITVAGARVDDCFEILLNTLGALPAPHVMTGLSREMDGLLVAEEFFYSAYPSAERWDEWHRYSVIVIGNDSAAQDIRKALMLFLKR